MATEWTTCFVLHLHENDRRTHEACYEVQILNGQGQATHFGSAIQATKELEIDGIRIPLGVIEAAKRMPIGKGDYVDMDGCSVPLF